MVGQYLAEYLWERATQPYYCVHPGIVSQLCRVDFDKIPSTMIAMPNPNDVVCVRLREANPILSFEHGGTTFYLRVMLVWRRRKGESIFIGPDEYKTDNDTLCFWMDYGEWHLGFPVLSYKNFPIEDGKSVSDVFHKYKLLPSADDGVPIPPDFIENCAKLFLSVGFLADCPNFPFEFDVLKQDRKKYVGGDQPTRDRCIAKARSHGKNGWLVGTDEMFIRRPTERRPGRTGTGQELEWAHIRGGHLNFYWCGPRSEPKLEPRWLTPTTVRPDLPFKPDG